MNTESLGPVEPGARIFEADVVRGFALFGVLLVNMYGFGADSIAWDSPVDQFAFAITHIFFDSKFWSLFCILFGFGFAVQLQRSRERGLSPFPTCFRRLTFLFVLGAIHTLFYDGDILMLYAELGLGLLLLNRLPNRWLLVIAVGLVLVFPFAHLATPDRVSVDAGYMESTEAAREELEHHGRTHVYATGTLAEVVAFNAMAIPANPFEDFNWADSGLAAFAMMLVGLVIGRSGIMRNIPANRLAFARVRAWGLGAGLTAMVAEQVLTVTADYAVFRPTMAAPGDILAGDLLFVFATVSLALGYAATLVLAARSRKGRDILAPLAGVGRMALTVYLTQTIAFTVLFYGYGFGAAFRMGPAAVTAAALVIFLMQIVGCHWWLRHFRYGPVEWLWRSLTYLKGQPMRLARKAHGPC